MPPVGDAPDGRAVWVVTLDEEVQRVATASLWPGSTEPAPQTDVAITRPVRTASVALAGREHLQFPLMVVDDQNPLLAFGEDGELIPPSLPMPAAKTWMLFPGDSNSLDVTGSEQVVTESTTESTTEKSTETTAKNNSKTENLKQPIYNGIVTDENPKGLKFENTYESLFGFRMQIERINGLSV
jgi:hypothetical protein